MTAAPVAEADVWQALSRVIDPELDCDIVALGLIYSVRVDGDRVDVTMTLTTPGCPMNELLPAAAKSLVEELPGVAEASVEVTWEPPWHFSRMSPVAREKLGLSDEM
jgi:metal-sulfur cluster biosynthetic enzyme